MRRKEEEYDKAWGHSFQCHRREEVSWNDFSDETGIEPARAGLATTPLWADYYGKETPDWYVQIAKAYITLRTGLRAAGYYRDEDSQDVYQVVNGALVYQGWLPHGHPVIPLLMRCFVRAEPCGYASPVR